MVRHSFRQGNKITDIFSRLGFKLIITSNSVIIRSPSNVVKDILKTNQDRISSAKVPVWFNCNKLAHFDNLCIIASTNYAMVLEASINRDIVLDCTRSNNVLTTTSNNSAMPCS